MRKLVFLICFVGIPCASWAQSSLASWENLNTLQAGEKIQVLEGDSKKISGLLSSVSSSAISLQTEGGRETIQKEVVRSVKLMGHARRMRDALIGSAVGAGVGAGIGAAQYSSCAPSQSFCVQPLGRGGAASIGAVVGGAGGAVVGALLPSRRRTIYRASAQ
jgi:hypothetical protein